MTRTKHCRIDDNTDVSKATKVDAKRSKVEIESEEEDYGSDEEDGESKGPKIYNESTHPPKVVTLRYDHTKDGAELPPMPIVNTEDLSRRTFLLN